MQRSILKSQAHRRLREIANGIDLSQFSMLTLAQYEHLLTILNLSDGERVLDLGCGLGRIAQSIHRATGAAMTAIDIDADVLNEATAAFGADVEFVRADIDDLPWSTPTFDAIYAVDTLYFSKDLNKLVESLYRILRPGGRLAIFWTQLLESEDDLKRLQSLDTDVARAFRHHQIEFIFRNFSDEEKNHWTKTSQALKDLADDFRIEGDSESANDLGEETHRVLTYIDAGRISRNCYLAVARQK